MRTAVITIAAGRRRHLERQCEGLSTSVTRADEHVVVAMRHSDVPAYERTCGPGTEVLDLPGPELPLPLARARNAGATRALERGAELLVFLDVDCIPGPTLLSRYADVAPGAGPALLCGPVAYLEPAPPGGYAGADLAPLGRPHPARPVPGEDEVRADGDHRLFWSLSFATTVTTWRRLGGFWEGYTGYGAEDTDLGEHARLAGIELCWVGGAWAFHQHHRTSSPPVQHLDDILLNAERFHRRWGWWPMEGWIEQFASMGLARKDRAGRWIAAAGG